MPALPKGEPRSRYELFPLTHNPNLSLPLGEMSRSDREGWNRLTWLFQFALIRICQLLPSQSFASQMPALPRGEPRNRCEFFCSYAQSNLSLPSGEMSRSDREGWNQLTWLFEFALTQTCLRVCPLSHLLRKCQLSQGESRETGANSFLLRTIQLVSPFGRDVAQRQRGLAPSLRELDLPQAKTEGVLQIGKIRMRFALTQTCLRVCPLSHLLRKCQLSQGESRETGANSFLLRTIQTCLSLWERCRAATERAGSLLEGAGLPPCGKTEGVLQIGKIRMRFALMRICQRAAPSVTACAVPPSSGRKAFILRAKQKRAQICTLFFGGRWWIRTTEVVDNRFTVCPLWPLGKPPIFSCRNRGAGGRT